MTPPAVHAPKQRVLLGIALRVGAMAALACLSALVKWTGARGVPVFEIIFFRNFFAFVPLGLYIWRTTGFEVLRTKRPLGHMLRATAGMVGMVCGFSALQHLPLTEALRNAPLGIIAPFDYTQLIWATLFGLVIWGELPHPLTLVGAVIVAGSGVYILYRELRRFRAA